MSYIILSGLLLLVLVVVVIGTFLPRTRTETKQCILNAPVDVVFAIVTNNQEWHYRNSLDDLDIIRTQGDIEEWEETTNGVTIRFKTLEKRPHTFYSFAMDSKMFTGEWQATFDPMEEDKIANPPSFYCQLKSGQLGSSTCDCSISARNSSAFCGYSEMTF